MQTRPRAIRNPQLPAPLPQGLAPWYLLQPHPFCVLTCGSIREALPHTPYIRKNSTYCCRLFEEGEVGGELARCGGRQRTEGGARESARVLREVVRMWKG